MIPATAIRGRKRKPGATSTKDEKAALDLLASFRRKLEEAPPEKEVSRATPEPEGEQKGKGREEGEDDDEAKLCDLHFIADCQSCRAWDAHNGPDAEQDDDDDLGWMSHALSFKADKLGKDLNYRKKAEEELVVIDPREKERTLKEKRRDERRAKGGETGREWDQKRNAQLARQSALAGRGAK